MKVEVLKKVKAAGLDPNEALSISFASSSELKI
jgi:hypothetical protein